MVLPRTGEVLHVSDEYHNLVASDPYRTARHPSYTVALYHLYFPAPYNEGIRVMGARV